MRGDRDAEAVPGGSVQDDRVVRDAGVVQDARVVQDSRVVQDATVHWIGDHWSPLGSGDPAHPAFGFLEIPFDYAVSHRAGTRLGPARIREIFDTYTLYCTDKRVPLGESRFHDLGAVDVVHSLEESYRRIRAAAAAIPPEVTPLYLGGDHSISDPLVRATQDRLGTDQVGLIVFDAHFDSRVPVPGKEHSGHWMKTLEGTLDATRAVQLGINAPIYGEAYMAEAEARGILVRTTWEIRRQGLLETLEEAVAHAGRGGAPIYVSVDIDSLQQSFAPGTSVPNPCGFLPHEVIDGVFEIASRAPLAGLDVNEVSPPLDTDDWSAHLAAHVLLNAIAGVVRRQASL